MPYLVFSILSLLFISLAPAQSAWQQPNTRWNNPVFNSYQSNRPGSSYGRYPPKPLTGTIYPKPFSATGTTYPKPYSASATTYPKPYSASATTYPKLSSVTVKSVSPTKVSSYQYGQQNQPALSSSPENRFSNDPSLTYQPEEVVSSTLVTSPNTSSEKTQVIQQPNNYKPVVESQLSTKPIPSYERYYSKPASEAAYPKPYSAAAESLTKVSPAQNSYQYGQQNHPAFSSSPEYRFSNAPSPGNPSLTYQPKGVESSTLVTSSEKSQVIQQPNNYKPVVEFQTSTKPIPSYERYYSKPASGTAYPNPYSAAAESPTKVNPAQNSYQYGQQNQPSFSSSADYSFNNAPSPENPSPTYESEEVGSSSWESENDSELSQLNSMASTDEIMETIEPLADMSKQIHQHQGDLALLKSKIAGKLPADEEGKNMWESLNLVYEYLSKANSEVHKYLVMAGAPVRH